MMPSARALSAMIPPSTYEIVACGPVVRVPTTISTIATAALSAMRDPLARGALGLIVGPAPLRRLREIRMPGPERAQRARDEGQNHNHRDDQAGGSARHVFLDARYRNER